MVDEVPASRSTNIPSRYQQPALFPVLESFQLLQPVTQPLNGVKDRPDHVDRPSGEAHHGRQLEVENYSLKEQVEELRARVDTLEQENCELSSRCKSQQEELEVTARINDRSQELSGLIDRLSAHEKKLSSCTDNFGETTTGFQASTEKISSELTLHASAVKQTSQKFATSAQESSIEMEKVSEQSKQVQSTLILHTSDVKSCSEKFQAEATLATTVLTTLNEGTVSKANKTIGDAIVSVKKLNMGLVNLSERITDTDSDISVYQDSLKSVSSSMDACSRGLDEMSARPAVSTKCQTHKTAQRGGHPSGSFRPPNSIPETSPGGHDNTTGFVDVADPSRLTMPKSSSSFLPRASQQTSTRQSMSQTTQRGHSVSRQDSFLDSTEGSRRGKRKNGVSDATDDLESPQPTAKKPRAEEISREKDIGDLLPAVIVNDDTSYQDLDADLQAKLKETLSNLEKNVGTNWPWFTPQMHAATTDNKHCVYLKCQRIKKEQAWSKEEACPKCVRARRACVLMTSHKDVKDRHLDNMRLLPLPQEDRAEGSTTSRLGFYVKSD